MKINSRLAFGCVLVLAMLPFTGEAQKPVTVPLSATLLVNTVQTLSDGNTLNHQNTVKFYRREDGSSRIEEGSTIVITDNTAHTVSRLNPTTKTATVTKQPGPWETASKAPRTAKTVSTSTAPSGGTPGTNTDLGTQVIDGQTVHGVQQMTTIPANSALGNAKPITRTVQVWSSPDLQLAVKTVSTDTLGGTNTAQYQDIVTGSPANTLFSVPSGYNVVYAQK